MRADEEKLSSLYFFKGSRKFECALQSRFRPRMKKNLTYPGPKKNAPDKKKSWSRQ
jgi:hypothetical protein